MITRFCSTFCLSHLSFQVRLGRVKRELLNFLSILAEYQQQTIIDANIINATGMRELSQEQLLVICRKMEMHGHKDLKAQDYIGKNKEQINEFYQFPTIYDKKEFIAQYKIVESCNRVYIFNKDKYVIKTPKLEFKAYHRNLRGILNNLLVEQQMIQVIAYNDANILTQMSEIIVLQNGQFAYYLAYKPLYELFRDIKQPSKLLCDSVLLASYLTELHTKTRLYHGDIKPANIFVYPYGLGLLRTDSDTLISLFYKEDDTAKVYQVKQLTEEFASKKLVSLWKYARANNTKVFFNQQFLMKEDYCQFKATVKSIFNQIKTERELHPLLYQFIDLMEDPNFLTVEQFFDALLCSPTFIKDFIIFLRKENNYCFSKGFQASFAMLFDHTVKYGPWSYRELSIWDTRNTHYSVSQLDQDLELNLYFIQDLSYELCFIQKNDEIYEETVNKLLSLKSYHAGGQLIQITRNDLKWLDTLRQINQVHIFKLIDVLQKQQEAQEIIEQGKAIALACLNKFAVDPDDPDQSQLRLMTDSLIFTLWRTITITNLIYKADTTLKDCILIEHIELVHTSIQLYNSDDIYKTTILKHFKKIIKQCFYIQKNLPNDCMKYTV
ncbi:hypothetical protein FGO68_gene14886 [Halteria grandinella]|uniref:Uncharacterized protein n=1 Tax=Halteria grandinella TaxID=5974 RepID=A0A8J8T5Y0_HALGN|nr:hypothetical protein FGO68_gene14886 [Halteria grandinella]